MNLNYIDATSSPVSYRVQRSGESGSYAKYKLVETEVESAWDGISQVELVYPNTFTNPATPSGWSASTGTQSTNTVLTLTANFPQTAEAVNSMIQELDFIMSTQNTNAQGSISVTLKNALWG